MSETLHLLDLLPEAWVEAPAPGHVEIQTVCIHRESRPVLFQHPDSRVLLPELRPGAGAVLHLGCAVKPTAWERMASEVRFELRVVPAGGRAETLLELRLHPRERAADRRWVDHCIDLGAWQGEWVQLELRTSVAPRASAAHAWCVWSDPRIASAEGARSEAKPSEVLQGRAEGARSEAKPSEVHQAAQRPAPTAAQRQAKRAASRRRAKFTRAAGERSSLRPGAKGVLPESAAAGRGHPDRAPHLLLVTADALRADALSCCGGPTGATPHLDALAGEGLRLEHCRAQSPTTVGSYATLLTGRPPWSHGLDTEWGRFPTWLPSLPVLLAGHGHHTVLAASERELGDASQGFGLAFAERLPCLGNPAQDGGITTRQLCRRLRERSERPCFAWAQYLDTHPPNTPPEPYRSLFYRGDPTDPARTNGADELRRVRGVESALALSVALPRLEAGGTDANLAERLLATAAALLSEAPSAPDLYFHLCDLGPRAWARPTKQELGAWLGAEAARLREGCASPELLAWLRQLLPELLEIERDICGWLEGVVDLDYAIAQYRGAVSYFDAHVGAIVASLRDAGLYDQTTIVVTSPHGECLGEQRHLFEHHNLLEASLRVPLILKPAAGIECIRGASIEGIFELVDLAPTLLELSSLPAAPGLEGTSRWPLLRTGKRLPDRVHLAEGPHGHSWAVLEGSHKLIHVTATHVACNGSVLEAGQRFLYHLDADAEESCDLAAEQPLRLRELLARLPFPDRLASPGAPRRTR